MACRPYQDSAARAGAGKYELASPACEWTDSSGSAPAAGQKRQPRCGRLLVAKQLRYCGERSSHAVARACRRKVKVGQEVEAAGEASRDVPCMPCTAVLCWYYAEMTASAVVYSAGILIRDERVEQCSPEGLGGKGRPPLRPGRYIRSILPTNSDRRSLNGTARRTRCCAEIREARLAAAADVGPGGCTRVVHSIEHAQ